jgi:hypothetical protein
VVGKWHHRGGWIVDERTRLTGQLAQNGKQGDVKSVAEANAAAMAEAGSASSS